ncbi:MAG TPA: hypothetical protein VHK69_08980 [Chitinophagaceae bacterium]|nr:hypothetical protein [Chitinophagaceae bacterium]
MHAEFSLSDFHDQPLHCTKCGWTGKGADTAQEYLMLTDAVEVYCPECSGYFGFMSIPDGHVAHARP